MKSCATPIYLRLDERRLEKLKKLVQYSAYDRETHFLRALIEHLGAIVNEDFDVRALTLEGK